MCWYNYATSPAFEWKEGGGTSTPLDLDQSKNRNIVWYCLDNLNDEVLGWLTQRLEQMTAVDEGNKSDTGSQSSPKLKILCMEKSVKYDWALKLKDDPQKIQSIAGKKPWFNTDVWSKFLSFMIWLEWHFYNDMIKGEKMFFSYFLKRNSFQMFQLLHLKLSWFKVLWSHNYGSHVI